MRHTLLAVALIILTGLQSMAAELKTKNVILITFDGLRWQEMFTGADELLLNKENGGVRDTNMLRQKFWRETPEARRQALLPFVWSVVAKQGQLLGNTNKGSVVHITNGMKFSYPGYNEILTGFPDSRINSNAKRNNPNVSVLEWLDQKPAFKGKVAAFTCWDVFPYILNVQRSGLPVYSVPEDFQKLVKDEKSKVLAELIVDTAPIYNGVLQDSFVYQGAIQYLHNQKPRLLYVSFGDTDDWAHEGRYDLVLDSARKVDDFIRKLWEAVQSMPEYKDKTTIILTTDHGRGGGKSEWRGHGAAVVGAEYIWMAAIGPDTKPLGERSNAPTLTQSQVAATIATLLGEDYNAAVPQAGKPVADFIGK